MNRLGLLIYKAFISFLLVILILSQNSLIYAQTNPQNDVNLPNSKYIFHGQAEINENKDAQKNIFTGKVKEIKSGTNLRMTVSSVLSSGYTQQDDEFFAEVVNDLTSEDGVVIPSGTIAHGKVSGLTESKRLGRDAYITINFDYMITPDGREIPIEASMTTRRSPAASVAKVALQDTAYTMAGGVVGGLLALKYLGLGAAVASHGYTVAGGAGVGAIVGVGISLARKGGEVLIAPGDEINVKMAGALQLPVMSEEAFKDEEKLLDGLDVAITSYKLEKDPFGEANTITLTLDIRNGTNKTFSSFDIALINDYKAVFYPSPFGDTELWFTKIDPHTRTIGKLSFAVDNPKRKHWLVFFDGTTRKPLARISVNNAKKRLAKEKNKK